jgi:uncharacterized protein
MADHWPAIPLWGPAVSFRPAEANTRPPRVTGRYGSAPGGTATQNLAHTGVVRLKVWVRPGSARPGVGGEHDGALVVRVRPRAVDGQATAAALAAIAEAFGVRRQAVTLVAGAASRMKTVDVAGADPAVLDQLRAR